MGEMPPVDVQIKPDVQGKDVRFANGKMGPMLDMIAGVIGSIILDDHVEIVGSQDRKGIYLDISFGDPEKSCPLFIGRRFRTVNAVLEIIRHQQLLKHNRYIEIRMRKPDGTVQKVYNQRVYGRETYVQKVADMVSNMKVSMDESQQVQDLDRIVDTCLDYIEEMEGE